MRYPSPMPVATILGAALAFATSAVALVAVQPQAKRPSPGDTSPRAAKVCTEISVVNGPGTPETAQVRGSAPIAFAATEVQDLEIRVHFASLPRDEHLLSVRLITPKGHLYQAIEVPLSRLPGREPISRHLPGYRRPIAVQHIATHSKTASFATVQLPVAGTQILQNSLYGDWTIEALLDDTDSACATGHFELTP